MIYCEIKKIVIEMVVLIDYLRRDSLQAQAEDPWIGERKGGCFVKSFDLPLLDWTKWAFGLKGLIFSQNPLYFVSFRKLLVLCKF